MRPQTATALARAHAPAMPAKSTTRPSRNGLRRLDTVRLPARGTAPGRGPQAVMELRACLHDFLSPKAPLHTFAPLPSSAAGFRVGQRPCPCRVQSAPVSKPLRTSHISRSVSQPVSQSVRGPPDVIFKRTCIISFAYDRRIGPLVENGDAAELGTRLPLAWLARGER